MSLDAALEPLLEIRLLTFPNWTNVELASIICVSNCLRDEDLNDSNCLS